MVIGEEEGGGRGNGGTVAPDMRVVSGWSIGGGCESNLAMVAVVVVSWLAVVMASVV
jgi:hypothetical protein